MIKEEKSDFRTSTLAFFPAEKKVEDVLFDEKRHKELLLKGGTAEHFFRMSLVGSKHIFLNDLESNMPGFGTAAMRNLADLSLEASSECHGNIKLLSDRAAIIFYLKMGMIPEEKVTPYVTTYYGLCAETLLDDLRLVSNEDELAASNELNFYKYVYRNEYKLHNKQEVTTKQLFDSIPTLIQLLDKKTYYLTDIFFPQLISLLKKDIGQKRPDVSKLGDINMEMSPLGKERWADTIKRKVEFKLFRDFSHLFPYMSEKQIHELKEVLAQHAAALKEPASQSLSP